MCVRVCVVACCACSVCPLVVLLCVMYTALAYALACGCAARSRRWAAGLFVLPIAFVCRAAPAPADCPAIIAIVLLAGLPDHCLLDVGCLLAGLLAGLCAPTSLLLYCFYAAWYYTTLWYADPSPLYVPFKVLSGK